MVKAFEHGLMAITFLDAFGCIESRTRLWNRAMGKQPYHYMEGFP